MFKIIGKYTSADVMIDELEESCIKQIQDMCDNEVFVNPIKIMPDSHSGKGSVIGFTMPLGDKIIPNTIGVDIGCGMLSYNIGKIDINHAELDAKIREVIPFGMNVCDDESPLSESEIELCNKVGANVSYTKQSVGSVGSGNHFIELGKSINTGDIWITVHSGSRNLGTKVCDYWQQKATIKNPVIIAEEIDFIKKNYDRGEWNVKIRDIKKPKKATNFDYLSGNDNVGYLHDMCICQGYATYNRFVIMGRIIKILNLMVGSVNVLDVVETIHNYVDFKDNIIRKGSIRSYVGERMIIPLNMRDGILLCEGKSNPDWNFSAPHGAGRLLSRKKAKSNLDMDKFSNEMSGIFSTSVCQRTIDEAPDAYKDSNLIRSLIKPTVNILDTIISIHNMKDVSDEMTWKKKRGEEKKR